MKNILRFPVNPFRNIKKISLWKILLISVLILLVSGWFYWFQYRPSRIRVICDVEARESVIKLKIGIKEKPSELITKLSAIKDEYKELYEACLHAKGLK